MLQPHHQDRLDDLRSVLRTMERAVVTFSGGVDSAVVLAVAHEQLGSDAVALTALSPTFPPEELAEAQSVAQRLGVTHILVDSQELEREGYVANAGDRCYFCKSELFELAQEHAARLGIPWVLDGTITDDLGGHRPGMQAASEQAVRHPLVEAGLDKEAVRAIAHELGLPVWDKPSFACLGSRFPVGTRVTAPRLAMVQAVESRLRAVGLRHFRARFHELEGHPLVRIELDPADMAHVVEPGVREAIVEACRSEGFRWVTLDLLGYSMGNLSRAL